MRKATEAEITWLLTRAAFHGMLGRNVLHLHPPKLWQVAVTWRRTPPPLHPPPSPGELNDWQGPSGRSSPFSHAHCCSTQDQKSAVFYLVTKRQKKHHPDFCLFKLKQFLFYTQLSSKRMDGRENNLALTIPLKPTGLSGLTEATHLFWTFSSLFFSYQDTATPPTL